MRMETPLRRVRGAGAAGTGAHHWWYERLSALAVLALSLWLVAALLVLPADNHAAMIGWLSGPAGAVPMLLLIVSAFWHARLGLRVVIDDYVHGQAGRFASIVLIDFISILGATLALFALLGIVISGRPA
jgi:succinate dehydrogenase / fumarate reductase, membrane anchor subunit